MTDGLLQLSFAAATQHERGALDPAARAVVGTLAMRLHEAFANAPARPTGAGIELLDDTWCAASTGEHGIVAAVDRDTHRVKVVVWAVGAEPVADLLTRAKTRRDAATHPIRRGDELRHEGLLQPFAELVDRVVTGEGTLTIVTHPLTDNGERGLMARLAPPAGPAVNWTVDVATSAGRPLVSGHSLRGQAPETTDLETVCDIVVIALCGLLARDAEARRYASTIGDSGLDVAATDFATIALQAQRAMWCLSHGRPPFQAGTHLSRNRLIRMSGARGRELDRVVDVLCAAGAIRSDGSGSGFVVAGAPVR